jgi:cytochrome d ubiquinol oxidase subunit I
MVALGTTFSAFWIMVNNRWMQTPVSYALEDGAFVATAWGKIIFSPLVWVRFPHVLLASYLTDAFCVAATGARYLLRGNFQAGALIMLARWPLSHSDPRAGAARRSMGKLGAGPRG